MNIRELEWEWVRVVGWNEEAVGWMGGRSGGSWEKLWVCGCGVRDGWDGEGVLEEEGDVLEEFSWLVVRSWWPSRGEEEEEIEGEWE